MEKLVFQNIVLHSCNPSAWAGGRGWSLRPAQLCSELKAGWFHPEAYQKLKHKSAVEELTCNSGEV